MNAPRPGYLSPLQYLEEAQRLLWVIDEALQSDEPGTVGDLAVLSGESREWRNLHKDAKNSRRDRGLVFLAAAFGVALTAAAIVNFAPWWAWVLLAAVVLPLLARAGRPADKPIIRAATTTTPPRFRVLNADVVLTAYYAAGLGNLDKPGQQMARTLADGQDTERILLAARQLRQRAGTLSGIAAGLEVATEDRDVLADVLQVFGGDSGLHWAVLAPRLDVQLPDRWSETTAEAVSAERFRPCLRCNGTGRNKGSTRKRFGECRRCKGSGRRRRVGAKTIHRGAVSLADKARARKGRK